MTSHISERSALPARSTVASRRMTGSFLSSTWYTAYSSTISHKCTRRYGACSLQVVAATSLLIKGEPRTHGRMDVEAHVIATFAGFDQADRSYHTCDYGTDLWYRCYSPRSEQANPDGRLQQAQHRDALGGDILLESNQVT